MAISRIKPTTWAVNEKLTSTQINQIDTSLTYALDKRDGYSDTLSSSVTVDNGGSFTFNSGTSLSMASGSSALFGGSVAITSTGTFTATTDSTTTLAGTTNITGNTTFSTGTVTVNSVTTLVGAVTAANFTLSSLNRVKLDSRSTTRTPDGMWVPEVSGEWILSPNYGYWISAVNTSAQMIMPLDLPHNALLTGISVYVKGAAGHANLPAVLPEWNLMLVRPNLDNSGTSYTGTDASADPTDFQTVHAIQPNVPISLTIDRNTYKYSLVFTSESGSNALSGLKVFGVFVTYTVTEMDDFR